MHLRTPDVRLYVPDDATVPQPCIGYIHGGGLVVGSVEGDDARAAQLSIATRCVVVASIEYRLAPEYPFPAGFDDCCRALEWIVERHDELGVDPDRIGLYGPSAGGALAVGVAQRARDEGRIPVAYMRLASPMLDDRTAPRWKSPSEEAVGDGSQQAALACRLHEGECGGGEWRVGVEERDTRGR